MEDVYLIWNRGDIIGNGVEIVNDFCSLGVKLKYNKYNQIQKHLSNQGRKAMFDFFLLLFLSMFIF